MSLPIIDFSPFLSPSSTSAQKLNVAKEIDKACRETGFFYISNHGIPSELTQAMLDNARTFFETSTPEEKFAIAIREAGDGIGDNARGWQAVNGGKKGSHECVDIFRPIEPTPSPPYEVGQGVNQWPVKPASFRSTSEQYVEAICSLGTEVVKAMALGLDVEEELFTSRIDRSFWNLRILSYEPTAPSTLTDQEQEKEKISGIGEHTDFGILTFLLTDPTPNSLQVLSKEGTWIAANPIPGCFLCNIGDMLATWTGGLYKSTRHRVLHNSDRRRISIPLFFDPNMDARIEPVLPRGVERKDEGVLYKEKFVKAIKYSIVV